MATKKQKKSIVEKYFEIHNDSKIVEAIKSNYENINDYEYRCREYSCKGYLGKK